MVSRFVTDPFSRETKLEGSLAEALDHARADEAVIHDVRFPDICGSNLAGLDWSRTHFSFTQFNNVSLEAADLSGGTFMGCVFENVDFSRARCERTSFNGSWFKACRFDAAVLNDANFRGAEFLNCSFRSASMRRVGLSNLTLLGTNDFCGADFTEWVEVYRQNKSGAGTSYLVIDPGKALTGRTYCSVEGGLLCTDLVLEF